MPIKDRIACAAAGVICVMFGVCVGAPGAQAEEEGLELTYSPPFIELGLGATNVEVTLGNGGLTAGVSRDGDMTVLSWPSPSYHDHIHYMTMNAPDARLRPRMGAHERMGAFAGVAWRREGEQSWEFSWLRDWDHQVGFASPKAGVVETLFTASDPGMTIRQVDLIPGDRDVLFRRHIVELAPDSPVAEARLIGYANLSPGLSRAPQVPLYDALLDHKNDFLAVWSQADEALVHFHPGDTGVDNTLGAILQGLPREFGPLGELLEQPAPPTEQVQAIAQDLDAHYAPGVYIHLSTQPAPQGYQVGFDPTDTCAQIDELADNIALLQEREPDKSLPADPSVADIVRCGDFDPMQSPITEEGWQAQATDAFEDATDGELEGSALAGGQVNTATWTPITFDGQGRGEVTQLMSFGETAQASRQALAWARSQEDLEALQQQVLAADEAFLDGLWIPAEFDEQMTEFSWRTFLNMRVGTDRQTGAIVASISRQPSYQLDWPRDGAFFNIALDLSGQHELVTQRMLFYADVMRREAIPPFPLLNEPVPGWPYEGQMGRQEFPPHSWEMNYYADGIPGGNIRLEIDNTALLVWAFVYHAGHLEEPARSEYIEQVWPTVQLAADWLAGWRDPETGLNWYANEDDHIEYTQGLQGASTTYGALVAAARMATRLEESDAAERWLYRAGELKGAVLEHLYVPGEGFYGHVGPSRLGAGSPHWLAWPTHMFDDTDARYLPQLEAGLQKHLADVRGETAGGQYPTKVAISAALVLPEGDQRREAYEIAERLATQIANPGTYTLGEHYSSVDADDDGVTDGWINGVSTPHLWSMALVYLTAAAYHHPERFDAYLDVFPEVTVPEVTPPGVEEPMEPGGVEDMGPGSATDMGPEEPEHDAGPDTPAEEMGSADGGPDQGGSSAGPDDPERGCQCSSLRATQSSSNWTWLLVVALGFLRLVRRSREL